MKNLRMLNVLNFTIIIYFCLGFWSCEDPVGANEFTPITDKYLGEWIDLRSAASEVDDELPTLFKFELMEGFKDTLFCFSDEHGYFMQNNVRCDFISKSKCIDNVALVPFFQPWSSETYQVCKYLEFRWSDANSVWLSVDQPTLRVDYRENWVVMLDKAGSPKNSFDSLDYSHRASRNFGRSYDLIRRYRDRVKYGEIK